MSLLVRWGATIKCSFGAAPSRLTVLPTARVETGHMPAATILANKPVNVLPFGMCSAPSNPQVAAATAAAGGVLTPAPCVPATPSPWTPGSVKVKIGGQPALHSACTLTCNWAGVITVVEAGQATVNVT